MIQSFDLTAANVHDIHMVRELTDGDAGLLLGDRDHLSEPLKTELLVRHRRMSFLYPALIAQRKGTRTGRSDN